MYISSCNGWDPLKSVIVGTATNANWPARCDDFRRLENTTKWKETPVPSGPVDVDVIREANEDLEYLCEVLRNENISVYRPNDIDFQHRDGMYNYCPRDKLLIVGSTVIDAPMAYACRQIETEAYQFLEVDFVKGLGRWDAANVLRLNDSLLYLVSESGDRTGGEWLTDYFSERLDVYILENIYNGVHIDSTIVPVKEGLVCLNASRISEDNLPAPIKNWDKIWVHEMVEKPFKGYPYASNWIGMNFFVVNPQLVICDPKQTWLRQQFNQYGVDSIGVDLRHSRTLGGGHHCTTLDLVRG